MENEVLITTVTTYQHMIYSSPNNSQHFQLNYHRVREGPNWFMMYYKNIATPCFTVKDVKSRLGSAKFLDSSKSLYKWMEEIMEKYDSAGIEMEGRADTSFASEALIENDKTRMVI